jgi:hypothetical protein
MPGRRPGCTRSAQKDIRRAGDHGKLVIAAILVVAGGLLLWGHNFVTDQVHTARRPEDLLPAGGSPEIKALSSSDAKAMTAYAGQLMITGAQAQTYADHSSPPPRQDRWRQDLFPAGHPRRGERRLTGSPRPNAPLAQTSPARDALGVAPPADHCAHTLPPASRGDA